MATLCQTVDSSRSDVQIGVRSAEGEEQNTSIHDARKVPNARKANGKHEWRSRSSCRCLISLREVFVVVGDEHAEEEDTQNVKKQDPVECKLDGTRNGLAGVLRFSDGHTDKFGAEVCKHGVDERAPESVELTSRFVAFLNVWCKSPRVLPVLEPCGGTGSSTNGEEERQEDDADDDHYFDRTEPEFEFSEETNTEVIDSYDDNQKHSDEHTRIDFIGWAPVLYNQGSRGQLVRRSDDIFAPVGPSQRETESRINKASCVTGEA